MIVSLRVSPFVTLVFPASEKPITLAMNKVVPTIKEVNLEAKKKEIKVASKISIMSDIDDTSKLIAKSPNPKKWAVLIGVENYKKAPYVVCGNDSCKIGQPVPKYIF